MTPQLELNTEYPPPGEQAHIDSLSAGLQAKTEADLRDAVEALDATRSIPRAVS